MLPVILLVCNVTHAGVYTHVQTHMRTRPCTDRHKHGHLHTDTCTHTHTHNTYINGSCVSHIILPQDKDGDRAIHHASFGDEPVIVQLLAEAGADLNARNRRHQTPLHVAINKGHVSVIRVLLNSSCHTSLQVIKGCV